MDTRTGSSARAAKICESILDSERVCGGIEKGLPALEVNVDQYIEAVYSVGWGSEEASFIGA